MGVTVDSVATTPAAESLGRIVERVRRSATSDRTLVVIGGCSRTGKSTLAAAIRDGLAASGVSCEVLSVDHWIVDVRERSAGSSVLDRFEGARIVEAVDALLRGGSVRPPVYDAVSRRRVSAEGDRTITLPRGVLVVEGVIGLLLPELLERAALRIYVTVPDAVRRDRMTKFYEDTKGLSRPEAAAVIADREIEEVPAVHASAHAADARYIGE